MVTGSTNCSSDLNSFLPPLPFPPIHSGSVVGAPRRGISIRYRGHSESPCSTSCRTLACDLIAASTVCSALITSEWCASCRASMIFTSACAAACRAITSACCASWRSCMFMSIISMRPIRSSSEPEGPVACGVLKVSASSLRMIDCVSPMASNAIALVVTCASNTSCRSWRIIAHVVSELSMGMNAFALFIIGFWLDVGLRV
mmetsp:Transcript_61380/g.136745  ORF Transcript_61380/g.136745 Transcript_61380/m.136745 type:complete len:202 (-) Transcript_61380:27-632(-)